MIKKIYCLGTSHTRGGGFHESEKVQAIYKNIVDNPSMDTLSWPGIFQNLVGNDIKVYNLAECGAGNERMYRILFEIISSYDFNKDECLFLLEPSNFDRKEFWSNTINDYVICNYTAASPAKTVNFNVVKKYYEKEQPGIPKRLYYDFLQETVNFDDITKKIQMNLLFFFTFLTHWDINFKIIHNYDLLSPGQQKYNKFENISYDINGKLVDSFYSEADSQHFRIMDETDFIIKDEHQGYFINDIVARTIYNKLVNSELLHGSTLEIKNTRKDFTKFKEKLDLKPKLI